MSAMSGPPLATRLHRPSARILRGRFRKPRGEAPPTVCIDQFARTRDVSRHLGFDGGVRRTPWSPASRSCSWPKVSNDRHGRVVAWNYLSGERASVVSVVLREDEENDFDDLWPRL